MQRNLYGVLLCKKSKSVFSTLNIIEKKGGRNKSEEKDSKCTADCSIGYKYYVQRNGICIFR